jgi:hypothetical protein
MGPYNFRVFFFRTEMSLMEVLTRNHVLFVTDDQ